MSAESNAQVRICFRAEWADEAARNDTWWNKRDTKRVAAALAYIARKTDEMETARKKASDKGKERRRGV